MKSFYLKIEFIKIAKYFYLFFKIYTKRKQLDSAASFFSFCTEETMVSVSILKIVGPISKLFIWLFASFVIKFYKKKSKVASEWQLHAISQFQ